MAKRRFISAGALALTASLAMVAVACGDDGGSKTSATTAGASTTAAAGGGGGASTTTAASTAGGTAGAGGLGTPNAAKGTPVKVGYISDGQSATIDNTEELLMAQATAKWANDYQGGIGGHPIEFDTCQTKQDPAVAADCANQMLRDKVVAVLFNVSGQSNTIAKIITPTTTPLFGYQVNEDLMSKDPESFVLSNGLASFANPALVAKEKGYTKGAWLVIDVPGATQPAKSLGVAVMAKGGVPATDIVAIPPGTADMGPQVQAELTKNPQVIDIIGDAPFCTTALQALRDASYKGSITMISNCLDANTIKTIGKGLAGIVVAYASSENPTDPDFLTFKAIIDKYGDKSKINSSGNPVGAFATVASFVRLMQGVTGDITPASVVARAKSAPPLPLATGGGLTFQCGVNAVAIIPAICTAGAVQATLDEKGTATNYRTVDPSPVLKLG
ncbi:MAG: putative branched-chain amino acid transport system [Acidimicrobiia bacterium]|nr:putative branched-chain amino acid transport system [Acidimicrobiia bacterium]